MALVNCPECGREISSAAKTCPLCGSPNRQPMSKGNKILVGIAVGVGLLAAGVDSIEKRNARPPPVAAAPSPAPVPTAEARAVSDARLESCRTKLKAAQALDLLHNMTFDGGKPKVWVGRTWDRLPIEAKTDFAQNAACFFLAGQSGEAITYPIFDGMTGKQIATWKYTRLVVE